MSENAFRVTKPISTSLQQSQATKIRRNRQALSCLECRSSKLKCDRQNPCSSCARKGSGTICTYGDGPLVTQKSSSKALGGAKGNEAQQRLQKLESIVANLVHEQSHSSAHSKTSLDPHSASDIKVEGDINGKSCPVGRLSISGSETSYIGATHWASVLQDIRGVHDLLDGDDSVDGSTPASSSTDHSIPSSVTSRTLDVAFNTICETSADEVRSQIPPKPAVDAMISSFFNSKLFQLPFIHRQTFQREYDDFWGNPSQASLLWVSMLFSILHLSQQLQNMTGRTTLSDLPDTNYLEKAKEALIVGNYSSGQPYAVEASLIIAMWIYYERNRRETDGWIIMGVCARLAMKQGYHREPSALKSLSPFEGEMRRRAFFFIETFDLLLSIQGGLPPMINQEECDIQPPNNLFDSDFDEKSTSLPASRPETDYTPALYFRYKSRLSKVFRKIYRMVITLGKYDIDDVMELDKQIRCIRDGIPPSLKFRSLASSITDDTYIIIARNHCEQMYLKGLCIMHRYFLTYERDNPQYEYSRRTCINAALDMLDIQADLGDAVRPGGRFSQDKCMSTEITIHDFLLVTMILCVEVHRYYEHDSSVHGDRTLAEKMLVSLRRARVIWSTQLDHCDEARRASKVLSAVLSKIPTSVQMQKPDEAQIAVADHSARNDLENRAFENGIKTPKTSTVNSTKSDVWSTTPLEPLASFDNFFGNDDGLDWSSIDQYVFQGMDLTPDYDLSQIPQSEPSAR